MRELSENEFSRVSGAVGDPIPHDNRNGAKWACADLCCYERGG